MGRIQRRLLTALSIAICACGQGSTSDAGASLSGSIGTFSGVTGDPAETEGEASSSSGSPGVGSCESVVTKAQLGPPPQDIIVVVDNSSSMVDEAGFVQDELNAFSAQIGAAAVNAHIVLITALPTSQAGLCIAPPLGSGGCPTSDTNPPAFLHIDTHVGSSDSLTRIANLYPDYSGSLRPTATPHILVISDDDTGVGPTTALDNLAAIHPRFHDLRFHAIVASEAPSDACETGSPCCEYATERGSRYTEIAELSGGLVGDICEQEFQPIFDALAEEVISEAKLPCAFEIPAPPDGEVFDRDRVNVSLDDGEGGTVEFGRTAESAACAGVEDGWFYDDPENPAEIRLCPQTCEGAQGLADGSISVVLGCETIPAA